MARRDLAAVPDRARLELEFDQPYLLGPLFGDYDRHLITIENRLGVHDGQGFHLGRPQPLARLLG